MFKKMMMVLILSPLVSLATAQTYRDIDVEGLCIDDRLDSIGFVKKFGKPDEYRKFDYGEGDISETYVVGENRFHFEENGFFKDFSLMDGRFAVLTSSISGGIRVGDKFSKLDSYKYGSPVYSRVYDKDVKEYKLFEKSEDPLYIVVKSGIIIRIYYVYSV